MDEFTEMFQYTTTTTTTSLLLMLLLTTSYYTIIIIVFFIADFYLQYNLWLAYCISN